MRCPVVNINRKHKYDVYIGRGGKWGNPFKIEAFWPRDRVIRKHLEWILTQEELLRHIHELDGKVLGCFCKPQACHGDTLADLVEASRFVNLTTGVLHETMV